MPSILRRLATLFAIAGGLAACAMALMTLVSIIGRAAFAQPIPGDIELTQFGTSICIALCLPWAQLHGSNIIVDFFTQRAQERTLRALDAFGALLLALMVGLLAWRTVVGGLSVRDSFGTTMILELPLWIFYVVLAPGLALTAAIALVQVKLHLTGGEQHPGVKT